MSIQLQIAMAAGLVATCWHDREAPMYITLCWWSALQWLNSMQSLMQFKLLMKHTWVSESGCGCSHDSRDQGVGFTEGRVGHMQPFNCNTIQSGIIQDLHSISIQGQAFEGQQGVVWLNHHITCLILVWEDTANQAVPYRGPQSRLCRSN